MANYTQAQEATYEIARRAHNKVGKFVPARSEEMHKLSGADLKALAGIAKTTTKMVKAQTKSNAVQSAKVNKSLLKAKQDLKKAFAAYKSARLASN